MSVLDRPLRQQAGAIASGDTDPVELLEATLARIEERNPAVNAIVDTFPDESRRMLVEAPRGGPAPARAVRPDDFRERVALAVHSLVDGLCPCPTIARPRQVGWWS